METEEQVERVVDGEEPGPSNKRARRKPIPKIEEEEKKEQVPALNVPIKEELKISPRRLRNRQLPPLAPITAAQQIVGSVDSSSSSHVKPSKKGKGKAKGKIVGKKDKENVKARDAAEPYKGKGKKGLKGVVSAIGGMFGGKN